MGINWVQSRKGLSMAAFMERYGAEEKCHAAVVALRRPNGFVCPACGETRHFTFERKRLTYWPYSACRDQTAVMCGMIFESNKLPLTTWFLAMHLMTQTRNRVLAVELKRHLGVRYKTAWLLKHKPMQVMREREESRQLNGRGEIDDAYLGCALPGGKSGRGSVNQVSFNTGLQTTETGRPLRVCLKKLEFTKEAIADLAKYAHRYLDEVEYRFNRRFDLSSILRRLLVATVVTPHRPERFLRAAEHCG